MSHGHHAHHHHASRRRLAVVLGLTCVFLAVEVAAGLLTGSLALLADAGHMLTDVAGLVLALAAMKFAERRPSPRRTYGYHRVEILAALTNALVLAAVAGYILAEAWERFRSPHPVESVPVLAVASVGLVVNLVSAFLLHAGSRASLNVRGAYNEVLADALSSVGVIAGAAMITATGWLWVDPLVAVAIALFVLPRTWALLREAVHVLLEGTPPEVDLAALRQAMEGSARSEDRPRPPRVDPHLGDPRALRPRRAPGGRGPRVVLGALRARVTTGFPISHVTVQLEERCCGEHAHA